MARTLSLLGFTLVVARNIFAGHPAGPPRVTFGGAWVPLPHIRSTSFMVWLGPVFMCLTVPVRVGRYTRTSAQLRRATRERGVGGSSLGALRGGF